MLKHESTGGVVVVDVIGGVEVLVVEFARQDGTVT